MARTDLTRAELELYRPEVREPHDFDLFWAETLAEAAAHELDARFEPVATPFSTVEVFDVSFGGFAGDRIHAWLTMPAGRSEPLPAVVEFLGYTGGRGLPGERLDWASAGYAHLLVDTRGQGAGWGGGATSDPHGSGASGTGFMTRGIESPHSYYYRRVYTDAVRAVSAVRAHPDVDATRVAVHGISQGGGIALAVSGLVPDLVAAMPDVPFLCHIERGMELSARDPFAELTRYLAVYRSRAEQVLTTLSYFDAVNFAARANAPALFSVALMDPVCPPSTVYAAYHRYSAAEKGMVVYPYNEHEGGGAQQRFAQIGWLGERTGASRYQ
ncbi:acetylxylan esterase [Compostimonas suwonensis]|uniref:Cephalosporin-C deacetylase n=1 Tax=Compostimonas suwonensis TaxID=1048394 RepID=A0A2M9BVN6_9MICO|nr:acetylxylan esterase [Compostimonas suwonensis]PJJ62013.1 cephalosporin-C deacetylase [Compostimonas suwonensis]